MYTSCDCSDCRSGMMHYGSPEQPVPTPIQSAPQVKQEDPFTDDPEPVDKTTRFRAPSNDTRPARFGRVKQVGPARRMARRSRSHGFFSNVNRAPKRSAIRPVAPQVQRAAFQVVEAPEVDGTVETQEASEELGIKEAKTNSPIDAGVSTPEFNGHYHHKSEPQLRTIYQPRKPVDFYEADHREPDLRFLDD